MEGLHARNARDKKGFNKMNFYEMTNNAEMVAFTFKVLALITLMVAAVMDIREKKILLSVPTVQMTFSVLYFLYLFSKGEESFGGLMLSLLPGAVLIALCLVTKQGIGLGDGLMVLSLGPLFGMNGILLVVFIAFMFSALAGGILLIFKRARIKSAMAFMPFLTIGVGVTGFAFI